MMEYRFRLEDPGEADIAGIVERLGAIIAYYRGTRGSTHESTKEVWGALSTMLRLSEKKWSRWIPLLVEQYDPQFPKSEVNRYFKELLKALLVKFAEDARGLNPSMKLLLAKSIRSALDSASSSPEPQICFFVKEFYPERLCDKRFRSTCPEVVGHEC